MKNKKKFKNTKAQIVKVIVSLMVILVLIVTNQGKQKVDYLNSLKVDIEGLQANLENKQEEIDQVKNEKQEALDGIQKLETDYTALKQQTDEMSKQLDNKQTQISKLTEEIIGNKVNGLVESILNEDFKKISKVIHPDKVRVINSNDILTFLKDKNRYEWGLMDVQGNQILLTKEEYFRQYIKDEDCLIKGKVQYASESMNNINDKIKQKPRTSEETYSTNIYVDYLYEGTKINNYTDWKSIRFIFEEYQSTWYLIEIMANKN